MIENNWRDEYCPELTLTDTDGADGWGGETYTISSDSSTVETGTLSSGAEDAVQFCLEDGAYTLALSGAGTAVEFSAGGLGLISGPASVPFEAARGADGQAHAGAVGRARAGAHAEADRVEGAHAI